MRIRNIVAIGATLCAAASVSTGLAATTAVARVAGFERGCTVDICVYARYNGHGWDAYGAPQGRLLNGHLDIFGPDHVTHHSGADRPWEAMDASRTFQGTGSGNVCAEAWLSHPDGHYTSKGLACIRM
ncbi:hypothetical protein [Kribbella sp. NPDC048928]|uniref:hypothetical protein n=1 Tax=Kribbella sp. NPDC048928 TaxID=3364111 RepID=UPI00372233B4